MGNNLPNGDLIKIRRDNVILRVPVEQKAYYMGLGYNVIGANGEVLEETVPTDIASLQRFYKDAKKKIAELEAEIKELKSAKKEKAPAPAKVEIKAEETDKVEKPVKSASTRRRKA